MKIDCKELLQNTSKDIRTVLYQASKVISEGQIIIEIERDEK